MLLFAYGEAHYCARSRGASVVTSRDFAASAARVAGWADPHASPAAEKPEHYDEVVEALAEMRARALPQSGEASQGPCLRVRVLVAGETSAVVARMFRQAGADVATCDLKPSEATDIPHFQGSESGVKGNYYGPCCKRALESLPRSLPFVKPCPVLPVSTCRVCVCV
jgi:hypothetical protein